MSSQRRFEPVREPVPNRFDGSTTQGVEPRTEPPPELEAKKHRGTGAGGLPPSAKLRRAFTATIPETARARGDAPTDEAALAALRTLRAWLGASAHATVYDQDHLPPDARSRDAYLRRHRALRRAGVGGAWMRGKVAACTPEAWATDLAAPPLAIVPGDVPSRRRRRNAARPRHPHPGVAMTAATSF